MEEITGRIMAFNQDRLPAITDLKYEGMAENLFRFYRGTNHIFYEDLKKSDKLPESPASWICGDLHLENFGSYKSDNRLVYFDLNDFDEAVIAPVIWELVRIITSIFIAFESLQIDQKQASHMAELFLKVYAAKLQSGKADYIEPRTAKGIVKTFLEAAEKRKQKEILEKRTILKKDRLEILLDDPRHLELKKHLKQDLILRVDKWLKNDSNSPYNYRVIDAVFRLAGTGSRGVTRYALLLKSENKAGEKYILIDMKESRPSSLQPFLEWKQPRWESESDRVISVQRIMQNRPPALSSKIEFHGRNFVIEEMQPTSDSINFNLIKKDYRHMIRVIEDMAMLTASSQLRSSGIKGAVITDDVINFGSRDDWQKSVLAYSIDQSIKTNNYYRQYLKDFNSGIFKKSDFWDRPSPKFDDLYSTGGQPAGIKLAI